MSSKIVPPVWLWLRPALIGALCFWSFASIVGANQSSLAKPPGFDVLSPSPEPPLPSPVASMQSQSVQLDPLNSPHPIPWNWVLANLTATSAELRSQVRYYRSQALVSPDGNYSAYSRIQMRVHPDFTQSRVSSVLFLENLKTGDLRTIVASSPLADPSPTIPQPQGQPAPEGTIAILIPVAWSESGDRILAREFESIFGSDIASDYAVVWDRQLNHTSTVAPTRVQYTNAVLLGWSQTHPDQTLFRAGNLGDPQWPLWTVDLTGRTTAAPEDQPLVFGQSINSIWTGPQAHL